MRLFKKTIYIAILSAIICSTSFVFANSARAQDQGGLSVVFTPNPLFKEANFLPGSNVNGSAQATNTSGEEKPIAVEAINIINEEVGGGQLFGDALNLVIKENSTELFNGTLTKFFKAGEIYLSNLKSGSSATYDFTITFNETAENKHQGKNLGFDILIGFQGEEGGGGSGNSGGGGIHGLSIFSEASTNITDTTAIIEWTTSYFSTSRVIYDTNSGVFDLTNTSGDLPLYGYSLSTSEYDTPANPNGKTYHKVVITGLLPNTTYYYRTISHASPPTISREHSFATLLAQLPKEKEENDLGGAIKEAEAIKAIDEKLEPISTIKKSALTDLANPDDDDNVKHEITDDAPLVKGVSLDAEEEENIGKTSAEEKGDKEIEENNEENIAKEDTSQETTKNNIKEWLLWILLFIIAIELYVLINNRKKRKKDENNKEINKKTD